MAENLKLNFTSEATVEAVREETFWDVLNPMWMFHVRPEDCRGGGGFCHGFLFLPGFLALLFVHVLSVQVFLSYWPVNENWAKLSLVPLGLLWTFLISADVKFRRQHPTREERWAFDEAFLNWFGLIALGAFIFVFLPLTILGLLLR
jgi:hypothetical protein